jgi:iron complex outermembrane recepter protein
MRKSYARAAMLATVSLQFLGSGQAFAQAANDAADDHDIIVNARRIEERLQDVPISISVVNQEQLAKANISSAEDLSRVVPGLNVQSRYSSEQANFAIRGFSQQARTSAAVGAYFAEVVAPRSGSLSLQGGDGAGPGNLFDLQSVQVLKGPQGTLFGRNTTGGAVLLVPRKPTDKFEGYVEGSYGNYDAKRLQAVVNLPISPSVRLRLGADWQNTDGYIHNISGIGPRDFGNVNYYALRGSVSIDLSPDIENYTILSYLDAKSNGSPAQIYRYNPAISIPLSVAIRPQVDRLNASGDPWQIEQKLINPETNTKSFQAINTTTIRVSDNITIKNIMSYSTYIQDVRQDVFSSNATHPTFGGWISTAFAFHPEGFHTNNQRNFTEELQLQGSGADGKLKYQAGLYYERSSPGGPVSSVAPGVNAVCSYGVTFTRIEEMRCRSGSLTPQVGKIWFTNMAVYAQATYDLTEQLKITGGLRYTYDRSRGESTGMTYTFSNAGIGYNVGAGQTFVAPRFLSCSPGFTAPDCTFSGKTSDKKPTWTLNLQYSPNDDIMLYSTYSRGYRQGAVTPFAATGVPFFRPEKLDNYELGAKFSLDGPVSGNLNFAGFYSSLTDQQLSVGLQNSVTGANATSILNGGKSRIYGLEFDGSLRFAQYFRLDGSIAYIDSKLDSIVPLAITGYDIVIPSAKAGDPLPFTPKWGINLGATFTLPTSDSIGKIELGATYRYSSSWTTSASNVSTEVSTPVKQLDLNLDWRNVAGAPVDLGLFATNVTNQFTQGVIVAIFNQLGYDARYLGKPRMFGARIRVRFGN